MSRSPTAGDDVARRLAETTLALVDTASVSRDEASIAEVVRTMIDTRDPVVARDDCLLYAPERSAGRPLVFLAGHLDTVPPQDNFPGRIDENAVHGLGASDMKGGLAVMIELVHWLDRRRPRCDLDVGFLFFSREELPVDESPIAGLLEASSLLRGSDLVVIMEPTANAIQLGCLGNLYADVTFTGTSAHSARPWLGRNAIHRAIEGLQVVATSEPKPVGVEGLDFYEVVSITGIEGGIARNVIPDEVVCRVNFRYAPTRTPDSAERRLRSLLGDDAKLEIAGNAPPARVAIDNVLVERLRVAGGSPIEPKQAWTNVAEFSAAGIDAINFGPGAPEYAHRADERVAISDLVDSYSTLTGFIGSSG